MGLMSKARDAVRRVRSHNPELAYLNESTSLLDLERRQKEIDSGRFRQQRQWPY